MRQHRPDPHLRLAVQSLRESDGYVEGLLSLARSQVMARQSLICESLRAACECASSPRPVTSRKVFH